MTDDNLTRAEAEARAAQLSVLSYEIVLDLTGDGDTFASTTTVRFRALPGQSGAAQISIEDIVPASGGGANAPKLTAPAPATITLTP